MASMRGVLLGGLVGASGGLLLGVILGALLVTGYGLFETGGVNIPYDANHAKLAAMVTVIDTTNNAPLTLKHVMTASAAMNPNAALDVFKAHSTYTESLWVFCSGNDIDVTMVIWGPGEDGETYVFGFGRHMWNGATISGFGQSVTWQQGGTDADFGTVGFTAKIAKT